MVKMVRIIHTYIHTCMHAYTHTHTHTYLHKIKILLPLHFILYTDDVSSANVSEDKRLAMDQWLCTWEEFQAAGTDKSLSLQYLL